ncbi:hypothetical protein F4804DRAFT_302913 [Jackrogersella minutella]|nr:hypothetical protein F4804DRAFT_302913 [Jackrogersella minutella]
MLSSFAAGDAEAFYTHITDDVHLTFPGAHALAGHLGLTVCLESTVFFYGPVKLHVRAIIDREVEV